MTKQIAAASDGMDIPSELQIPQAERDAHWEANPPKAMPAFAAQRNESDEDRAAREKLLAKQAARKRIKTAARISKMKARTEEGRPGPGMRWDPSVCKFVPDIVASDKSSIPLAALEENDMTKTKTKTKTRTGSNKKNTVLEMARRANGVTVEQVVDRLKVTLAAARSLIGDVKRSHPSLKRDGKAYIA